jgi:hypothetical protein
MVILKKQVLSGGLVAAGGEGKVGKSIGGWMWCKYCAHMYVNGKLRPVETIPGIGEE